jgi:hypothetical protein
MTYYTMAQGTEIHTLAKGVGLMAGDVEGLNGKGSHSALGQRYFRDEAFYIPHSHEVSLIYYYSV